MNYKGKSIEITISEGFYEIGDNEAHIKQVLHVKNYDEFSLKPKKNTFKCEIYSYLSSVDFQPADCIGPISGFSSRRRIPRKAHLW